MQQKRPPQQYAVRQNRLTTASNDWLYPEAISIHQWQLPQARFYSSLAGSLFKRDWGFKIWTFSGHGAPASLTFAIFSWPNMGMLGCFRQGSLSLREGSE